MSSIKIYSDIVSYLVVGLMCGHPGLGGPWAWLCYENMWCKTAGRSRGMILACLVSLPLPPLGEYERQFPLFQTLPIRLRALDFLPTACVVCGKRHDAVLHPVLHIVSKRLHPYAPVPRVLSHIHCPYPHVCLYHRANMNNETFAVPFPLCSREPI